MTAHPPDATADRIHAGGRNLFHLLVDSIKTHRAGCQNCQIIAEELAVAGVAEQVVYAAAMGGIASVRRIAEGLAYAAVRAADDQTVVPNLADYTATEGGWPGGAFDA